MTDRVISSTDLDLRRIGSPEAAVERVFTPDQVRQGDDEVTPVGEVAFSGRIQKKDDRYRLVGRVHATLALACSRCLESFQMPVDVEVDLTYLPQAANVAPGSGGDEVELADEDLTTAYYCNDVLDLAQMLREQFYLVMPMRPMCRDDCRGLCPRCGTNLNVDTCGCSSEWQDPRLAGLRTLIDKQDS